MSSDLDKESKLKQKLILLEEKERIRKLLPHKYGYKDYAWAREFMESTNKMCLLTAANQIGKSSIQIRKCIEWATNKSLWAKLWRNNPIQFWYLYPDGDLATSEFENKWIPEFMPTDKNDPVYGWEVEYKQRQIKAVHFKSGVSVYFKTYSQDVHSLQAGTVHYIACDEELVESYYAELYFRLSAVDGYFSMVFTATRGQEFWREAMEEIGTHLERFKGAWKRSVSKYDCLFFEDGTPSHWTIEKIEKEKEICSDENEINRRIYGKFVRSDGRRYVFNKKEHYKVPEGSIPKDWLIFCGVDVGSGRPGGAPSAITFIGVSPDMRKGRVFRFWRGDKTSTTAGDVFEKYMELSSDLDVTYRVFDYGAYDFGEIAGRNGVPFEKAKKDRTLGDEKVNTVFKFGMLTIDDIGSYEHDKLATELTNLGVDTKDGDDGADSLRYAVMAVPWDMRVVAEYKRPMSVPSLGVAARKPGEGRESVSQIVGGGFTESWGVEEDLEDWYG